MNIGSLIDRMIAGGLSPGEAGSIAAEIYAAGVAAASVRSAGAERTRRYRERQSVTKRHKASPSDTDGGASQSVTERHQPSQCDAAISISDNKKEEESKIDIPDRHTLRLSLAADQEAREIARQRGLDPAEIAAIYLDFLEGKPRKPSAGDFRNFLRQHRAAARKGERDLIPEPSNADYDRAAGLFAKNASLWSSQLGPEPGMTNCRCPSEILIKHGIDPKSGLRMQ